MSDQDALLAAVCADPADDLPRLAYADLCEERGDLARAEYVRLSVTAARLEPSCRCAACKQFELRPPLRGTSGGKACTCDPTWRAAKVRCSQMLNGCPPNGELWAGKFLRSLGLRFDYRRGFVGSVELTLAQWLEYGPRLVELHPLAHVRQTDAAPTFTTYPAPPTLNHPPRYWDVRSLSTHLLPDAPGERGEDRARRADQLYEALAYAVSHKYYPTEQEAHLALSVPLLAWARSARPHASTEKES